MRMVLTTCAYCGCGCNLYLHVNNSEEIVGVSPSTSHPVSNGRLCVKGWRGFSFVNHGERLKKPLIKQKNGTFIETSWDRAISIVSNRLKDIMDRYGPKSIGVLSSARCTNEENYLMTRISRSVFKTPNIDHCARLWHSPTVASLAAAFGSGAMTNSIDELEKADCIFVIGSNTTEQHPLIASRIQEAVRKNKATLMVVDPRKIPLTEDAYIYARITPGTNLALINAMLHVIIKEDLVDHQFIGSRTQGFEELKASVEGFGPEIASKITGIPASTIEDMARIYATADRGSIVYAMGITQHVTGSKNVAALANLAMITGNIGRESTGVNPLRGQNNVQGACDMGALPNCLPGYQKLVDEQAIEKFKGVWGDFNRETGLTVTDMTHHADANNIRAMYIMGENPAISDPDINRVKAVLADLEFLVVQDIFLTETAQLADVVLPGASFAEKDGTFTNTERRVQRVRRAIQPVGESKADWEILCEIARAMGCDIFYSHPSEIMDEIASLVPSYAGIDYNRLEKGGLQWPCPDKNHPGTKYLHKDKFAGGLGKFTVNDYIEPAEMPDEQYPFILTTGRILHHYHTGTMTRRSWALDFERPEAYIEINPSDAQRLGLSKRSKLRITSRRGSLVVKPLITDAIGEGVVFMPFHYNEAPANILTSGHVDPKSKIPELKVTAVRIEEVK